MFKMNNSNIKHLLETRDKTVNFCKQTVMEWGTSEG